ncbi:MAG TPA: cytochrome c [Hyphomicrobiaceae bacterium]|nr:cytochrome c [Hyphomicrobiaceae bacterium]
MLRIIAAVAAIAVGATIVHAQSAAIGQRKDAFKAMGGAMKDPVAMAKGEQAFDLAKVQASLKTIGEKADVVKGLFPDDSKTGGDTKVLPVAFEKKADFLGRFDKLAADVKAAQAAIKDEASFKAEWGKIGANCGACHKEYRQPQ